MRVDDEGFADDVFAVNGDKDYEDVSDHEHILEGVHYFVYSQAKLTIAWVKFCCKIYPKKSHRCLTIDHPLLQTNIIGSLTPSQELSFHSFSGHFH